MRWRVHGIGLMAGVALHAATGCTGGWRQARGAATLHYEAQALVADDAPGPTRLKGQGIAGIGMRALVGKQHLSYVAGFELGAGFTVPAGFAYRAALLPIGIGWRWPRAFIALAGGIGAEGATARIDDAGITFGEFSIEAALTTRTRLMLRASAGYAFGGAADAPVFDGVVALRLSRQYDQFGVLSSNGYYLGAAVHRIAATPFIGIAFGYAIDAHMRESR